MYSIYILWLLIIALSIILIKLLNIKKNYIVCFCTTILIILFILNLQDCMDAALMGCSLVVKAIVPTIFPFTVICNILISYDGIGLYSKVMGPLFCKPLGLSKACSFPLAASFLCGYPLGAKYCSEIYEMGYIKEKEYLRVLNIATNAGPIFLIGSVGAAMLSSPKYGYILLIANYLSIIIVGFLTKRKNENCQFDRAIAPNFKTKNFGTALKQAIESGINTTLTVGAFVIMFSVFISIIKNNAQISIVLHSLEDLLKLPTDSLYGLFLGSIEFTNGCKLISTSTLSINLKLSMISFICSFSSLSVIAQVSSVVSKYNPPMKKYIFWKFIQGVLSFFITFGVSKIFLKTTTVSNIIISTEKIYTNAFISILPVILLLILTLICKVIFRVLRKLHTS
ncbi:sporulation integral membrane protein YlbJ [Clostridium chauvoei]|uniref:Sporulation integral membrane protein YlbJ n=2 Tax=Clostridium chauvoei TaxID=46867 RepID=A0A1U6JAA5_9CLOT|nr:sporulation integral membrane protein YlbJ [Clostridium chauvoei]ATD54931.1 sporulation integral membrane protein YlbJ [Clostridium chauvoei]ATD57390.1 sporulation integral membrane protein YlbJ [Clostridium chauvoei]MBX7280454.1 sporulation integral membrane protein YlbJ [Clostridium chauvoei]MBX7282939.1 sporulation integral membrane protein YlbJ [Clostridium chauvoei]MBX7285456.1 sporulation integral membrane protein YlbJ [Clostridium chauvoei]